ncbi:MAG: rhodanese-like domain-containing protein [Methanoregula sp.]
MTPQKESTSRPNYQVPEKKQTGLWLYVTSQEAYEMWKARPERVYILDVRTPEEYVFVGHAEMARNIPFLFVKHEWNTDMKEFVVVPNPDFIAEAKRRFASTDTILVMCRAGDRSALAVNALAKAGFVNVYNIIDGMEGDKVDDPGYAYHGKRMRNGWKNSGSRPGPIPSIRSRHACLPSRSDVFFEDFLHLPSDPARICNHVTAGS